MVWMLISASSKRFRPLTCGARMDEIPNDNGIAISRLQVDDLPALLQLSQSQGWSHTKRDWDNMLKTGKTFGHYETGDSKYGTNLISCAHFTEFGKDLASLGMVIVSQRFRNRGLATSLIRNVMDYNHKQHQSRPLGLIASTKAQPLYPRFGFDLTGEYILKLTRTGCSSTTRFEHDVDDQEVHVRPLGKPDDIQDIIRLDHESTGLDRGDVVRRLLESSEAVCVAEVRETETTMGWKPSIMGYGVAKRQGELLNIGPLIAPDSKIASVLCREVIAGHNDGPIRMDVFESQREFVKTITSTTATSSHGLDFQQADRQALMIKWPSYEENSSARKLPGHRQVMFCPASQAWL